MNNQENQFYPVTEQELAELDHLLCNAQFTTFRQGIPIQQWLMRISSKQMMTQVPPEHTPEAPEPPKDQTITEGKEPEIPPKLKKQ